MAFHFGRCGCLPETGLSLWPKSDRVGLEYSTALKRAEGLEVVVDKAGYESERCFPNGCSRTRNLARYVKVKPRF